MRLIIVTEVLPGFWAYFVFVNNFALSYHVHKWDDLGQLLFFLILVEFVWH